MPAYVKKSEHRRRHTALAEASGPLPEGWLGLALEDRRRERVTMRMPVWVLTYFRALGPGYQGRIETVLAAFVSGRLGGTEVKAGGDKSGGDAEVARWFAERREALEERREALRRREEEIRVESVARYRRLMGEE